MDINELIAIVKNKLEAEIIIQYLKMRHLQESVKKMCVIFNPMKKGRWTF